MTEPDFTYFRSDPKPDPTPKNPYKGLKRTAIKKKVKEPTGEKEVFLQIWNERPHVSQVSGDPLGEEPNVWFFAHLLGKKAYPRFKLKKENIFLMTPDEHLEYDCGDPEGSEWDKVYQLKEELKIEYYKPSPTI